MQLNFPRLNGNVLKAIYLPSFLFLTMSNFAFLIPIILSLKRQLYIESLVYMMNMFFSLVSRLKS